MGEAFRIWLGASRPRTLTAAVAPVLMGTALAARDGQAHAPSAAAALLAAIGIQIGTNFANDYYDFRHGADTGERTGPRRATQSGLVRPEAMRRAFLLTFGLSAAAGLYLVLRGGWPILVIGLLSILFGVLYTGGPRPLGYLGLGDILVVIFFGPIAVAGTHYAQALEWSGTAAVAGLAPGFLSTALLVVNNLRDTETDRKAGKRTLAVRFGRGFAKAEYALCLVAAGLVPIGLWASHRGPWPSVIASVICLTAVPALRQVIRARPGDALLPALAGTGRTLALYGLAFSIGWVIP